MESGTRQLKQRQRLKQLIEIYALRARRLSEALAVLDGQVTAQRQIDGIMKEIRNLSCLVEQAGADLLAFVDQRPEESPNE